MSDDSRRASLERAEDLAGTARSGKVRKSEVWRESSEGGGSRVRTKSGWDQLPEGFQSAEEALQATRSNAGNTGWSPHYQPGFSGWNGGPNMHYPPGDNRYMPGHGRGMLPGPAAERAPFEKSGWSRGEHPRRSRWVKNLLSIVSYISLIDYVLLTSTMFSAEWTPDWRFMGESLT